MSKLFLGIAIVCLYAGQASAAGFEMPPLPDFSLQRGYGERQAVDRDLKTGSIPDSRAEQVPAAQPRHKHRLVPPSGSDQ